MTRRPPRLSIVLHTHMPYVEGFGTWPFGEEWLWEATATSYLPLLEVLDAAPGRVTVSLTPVLLDQLSSPGATGRLRAFLRELRAESHRLDLEHYAHDPAVAAEIERSAARYAAAADALDRRGGDLVAAFAPHAAWTSAATHAVLPLLATDEGVRLQVSTGIESHRARFGAWAGGFWLPECAHAPWLDPLLEAVGVHATCVDLTDVLDDHSRPLRSAAGPLLVPIDRAAVELVWSDGGYPGAAPYRSYQSKTPRHHRAWAVDGAVYDEARARGQVRADAADFVSRVRERSGLCVVAVDTELLGHWWFEGPWWLEAVIEECEAQGLALVPLDEALPDAETAAAPADLPVTSWGTPRDLTTWTAPPACGLAWRQRAAELRAVDGPLRARRELLALQSSDWAFLMTRELSGPYPLERAAAHEAALDAALRGEGEPQVRNLAPFLQ